MDAKMIISKGLHLNLFQHQEDDELQQTTESSQVQCVFLSGHIYDDFLRFYASPKKIPTCFCLLCYVGTCLCFWLNTYLVIVRDARTRISTALQVHR